MTSFMLLYNGPATTPEASHEGWPEWFQSLGDKLVDQGSPMTAGFVVAADPMAPGTAASLNGYTVIRPQDRDAVGDLHSIGVSALARCAARLRRAFVRSATNSPPG